MKVLDWIITDRNIKIEIKSYGGRQTPWRTPIAASPQGSGGIMSFTNGKYMTGKKLL